MDRGAWQTMVHRITKSGIQLKQLSMHILSPQDQKFATMMVKSGNHNSSDRCFIIGDTNQD